MTRQQKVDALIAKWDGDYQLMLRVCFMSRFPKARKDYRVVSKWLNRMKRVRRIVERTT